MTTSHAPLARHPGETASKPLMGLNLFRAFAVILMILAHAARLQNNMSALSVSPAQATAFDRIFLFVLTIEPMISAMFLFIAGFSLVLSHAHRQQNAKQWLRHNLHRALQLYAISVVFFLADQGVQWPDALVSSGVLSVIAVAIMVAASCLVTSNAWQLLALLSVAGLSLTAVLEHTRLDIPGINAGAGGLLPLVVIAWFGTLTGIARQRWPQVGLQAMLVGSLLVSLFALSVDYPWVTRPTTSVHLYPGDRIQSVIFSLQDAVGLYNGTVELRSIAFWNHSSIFPLRALPLLVLMLMAFILAFRHTQHATIKFFNRIGRQALNVYVLHLLLLAVFEVSGLKPNTGWQTLLICVGLVAIMPLILRYVSLVPWRLGVKPTSS